MKKDYPGFMKQEPQGFKVDMSTRKKRDVVLYDTEYKKSIQKSINKSK